MKKLIKICLALLMPLTIVGCSSSQNDESASVKILCPSGAPALAFVSEYENIVKEGKIDFVDGSDMLMAELVKDDSEYDMIVAPINIGAKLLSQKQTNYKMDGVLTWGNLYLVGTDENVLTGEGEIALFGKGAVPEKIYQGIEKDISLTPTYYNSATLVQQQLLAKKAEAGLLAEPLATATIAKAKQNGIELKIIKDLQESGSYKGGYPQATIFIKEGKNFDTLLENIDQFTNNNYPDLQKHLETIGIEKIGLPSVELTVQSIERQNLHYKKATDCKDEITQFLKSFQIEFSEDMIHD